MSLRACRRVSKRMWERESGTRILTGLVRGAWCRALALETPEE